MSDEIVRKVFAAYGYKPERLLPARKGYRNESRPAVLADGTMLNIIFYKSEPGIVQRIRRTNAAANHVAANGLPARTTADQRIMLLHAKNGAKKHAALYTYLPGSTIPWAAYTQRHIKLLGKALSDTHDSLRSLDGVSYPSVSGEYAAILQRMRRYFADPHVAAAMQHKLRISVKRVPYERLTAALQATGCLPGQQVLHMDLVRGNILFEGSGEDLHVSGLLDFEKAAYGHPVFDIARTLAFLLVDCKYKAPQKVRKYFLESGYNKRGHALFEDITLYDIPNITISILDILTDLFLLYDFYKFLRHNPYESLHLNEHFTRTSHMLIQRALLQTIK